MSRRMDIELTSSRSDGSWTWRAAGALNPKGFVDSSLLPSAVKVGDVLRVEVEIDLDGVWVTSILPNKSSSQKAETLSLITEKSTQPGVTVQLANKGPKRDQRQGERGKRRNDATKEGSRQRISASGPGGKPTAPSLGERDTRPRSSTRSGTEANGQNSKPGRFRDKAAGLTTKDLPEGVTQRNPGDGKGTRPSGERQARPAHPMRPRPIKLVPATKHIDELYQRLSAEEIPVAEKLAAGGMPALRRALQEEKDLAAKEGRTEFSDAGILQIAERILSAVKEAAWRDKADAAVLILDHIALRDLRAVVSQAVPRDDEGRELLQKLRLALNERLEKLRNKWETDIMGALDGNKTLQALRLSAKSPEPTAKLPATLATKLGEAVSHAMTSEIPVERWITLLEAAATSPIRRLVKPIGIPESMEAKKAAAKEIGRIPAIAHLLGISMPPPPGPPSIHHPDHHKPQDQNDAEKTPDEQP